MRVFNLIFSAAVAVSAMGVGAVYAADLPARTYTKATPMMVDPTTNWSGFYIGAEGGYASGNSYQAQSGVQTSDYHPKGGFGGGTVGFNWQSSQWVFGVETDLSEANLYGSLAGISNGYGCINAGPCESRLNWFGTFRGRIGYVINSVLLYATGGLAYGNVHTDIAGAPGFDGSTTRTGWTAGGGVEYMFAPAWSAKVEYLRIDLGRYAFSAGPPPPTTKFEADTIKGGINYHFNWSGPVVAKY